MGSGGLSFANAASASMSKGTTVLSRYCRVGNPLSSANVPVCSIRARFWLQVEKFTQQIWINECLLTFYLSAPVTTFWSKRFEHQWPSHLPKNFGCQTITQYLVCGSEFSLDAPFSPELGVDWRCEWSELGLFSPTPDEVDDVVEECWNCESDECKCISVIIGYIEGAILIWEKKSTFFCSNLEGSWVHLKSATAAL